MVSPHRQLGRDWCALRLEERSSPGEGCASDELCLRGESHTGSVPYWLSEGQQEL